MFSAMLENGYTDTTKSIWTITSYSSSDVRIIGIYGNLYNSSPGSFGCGACTSINLNSNVYITAVDGTSDDAYILDF